MKTWSWRQAQCLHLGTSDKRLLCVVGGVRCGKTTATVAGFLRWAGKRALTSTVPQLYLIATKSSDQWRKVIEPVIAEMAEEAGLDYRYAVSRMEATLGSTLTLTTHSAKDVSSRKTLQGMTLAGAYLDEAVEMDRGYVEEVIQRCSVPGAKVWMTMNPAGPDHWIKREVIDQPGRAAVVNLTIFDNPSLEVDYVRSLEGLQGWLRRRRLDGEWVAAGGLIWEDWEASPPPTSDPTRGWIMGVDHATASVSAAVLIGVWEHGAWVVDEWRHDRRKTGRVLADADQVRAIQAMLGERVPWQIDVDPHAYSMKAALAQAFPGRVQDAENDVTMGIEWVRWLLTSRALRIAPNCVGLINEIKGYQYDERKQALGEDYPLTVNDHECDATRYACTTSLQGFGAAAPPVPVQVSPE